MKIGPLSAFGNLQDALKEEMNMKNREKIIFYTKELVYLCNDEVKKNILGSFVLNKDMQSSLNDDYNMLDSNIKADGKISMAIVALKNIIMNETKENFLPMINDFCQRVNAASKLHNQVDLEFHAPKREQYRDEILRRYGMLNGSVKKSDNDLESLSIKKPGV